MMLILILSSQMMVYIISVNSIQPSAKTNQTDIYQLFDGSAIGQSEPESFSEPVSEEIHTSLINGTQPAEQTNQTDPLVIDGIRSRD